MIIGIAGPTASGKTTVAELIADELDAFRIKYSDLLSMLAFERGLDANDKSTLQNLYLSEREERGEDFLAKEMEQKIDTVTDENILIEGNRRVVDIPMLRRIAQKRDDKLFLLFIDASVETRFARYNSRLQKHDEQPITYEAFLELEKNGAEDELAELRNLFEKEGLVIASDNQTPEEIFATVKEHLAL